MIRSEDFRRLENVCALAVTAHDYKYTRLTTLLKSAQKKVGSLGQKKPGHQMVTPF